MIATIKALVYAVFHHSTVYLTVVRRYVDAQSNFIGELYLGEGRDAKMVGMTCDSFPFDNPASVKGLLEFRKDFTEPMEANVLRVGSLEPAENDRVRSSIALLRFCPMNITVFNRFVEHVLEKDHVRK